MSRKLNILEEEAKEKLSIMKTVLKWFWRVLLFPFVLAVWLSAGIIMGLVIPCDWLINPDKWNSLNRKEEKNI